MAAGAFAGPAQPQIEIQWWHSMGGALGEKLNALADKFGKLGLRYDPANVHWFDAASGKPIEA